MKNSPLTSSSSLESLKTYYETNQKQILSEYLTFLEFPSISTDPTYQPDVISCLNWLSSQIKKIGLEVEIWETKGHPTLFASWLKAGPKAPTVLIYNHYDVQPVDPLDLWESPPFKPVIKNGNVYARGAEDNKGQCLYTLQALKALITLNPSIPVNIKLCIEGEEEMGSQGLAGILKEKKDKLKADYLVIVDLGIPDAETPAVTLGCRGIVTMDVELTGSSTDLHSGSHGGIAYNPIRALVELLAKLYHQNGEVAIPGFYDDVKTLSADERGELYLDFDETSYFKEFGAYPLGGESQYSPTERAWIRPTLEINGINGGYSGAGFKTVLPAKASAKISCRLVPDQDPKKIGDLVARFLQQNIHSGFKLETHIHPGGGRAVRANPSSAIAKAFSQAYSEVFQKPCRFILEGGSIPITTELARVSESETILVGLGLATDRVHAPNEHFGLDRLEKGFLIIARALTLISRETK